MFLSEWAGVDYALICHISAAQTSIPDSQSIGSAGSPPPQQQLSLTSDMREKLRELRTLIQAQTREMERLY